MTQCIEPPTMKATLHLIPILSGMKRGEKLIGKLNYRVALTACFMFIALQVDRGNLSNATSDNFWTT